MDTETIEVANRALAKHMELPPFIQRGKLLPKEKDTSAGFQSSVLHSTSVFRRTRFFKSIVQNEV